MRIKLDLDIKENEMDAFKDMLQGLLQSVGNGDETEEWDDSDDDDSSDGAPDLTVINNDHQQQVRENFDFETYKSSFEMQQSHLGRKKDKPEDMTKHQEKGKEILADLLSEWEVNFAAEDESEQPDRLQLMHNLGNDGRKAGAVISFCMASGGLTQAVHIIREENNADADPEFSRIIAANICQLASIVIPPLSDLYEFSNPLTYDME